MKDTGVVDHATREPYRVCDAAEPRYGHRYDVIDMRMQTSGNRVFAAACDADHARQIANSANYWHGCRLDEGTALAGEQPTLLRGRCPDEESCS